MSVEREAVAAPIAMSAIPPMLGDYTLLTKLASGGMATVYVGRKRGAAGFERLVAIKCCHPHLRDDEEFSSMFLDEARLCASIRHPNVVATLDVSDGDLLYLVMEYVEGFSLAHLIRQALRNGALIPPGVALRVMIDTLTGLHAAHELRDGDGQLLNLVHRDVSPQNILVGVDGVARITDFGIAFASARATVTQEGRIKGKFSYIAPEQVKSQQASRRMDVFSAGAVLWEALTGRPLFRRQDEAATINAVLNEPIPPPSRLVPSLPSSLDTVVLKALHRNPAARYQTASDLADALERLPIERVTARAVAAHLDSSFGTVLAERRKVIKEAPQQQLAGPTRDAEATHSRVKASLAPMLQTEAAATGVEAPVAPVTDDIEHRRLRGLLAAAMLLLVGSALGLLLARSNGSSSDDSQPTPSNQPAPKPPTGAKR